MSLQNNLKHSIKAIISWLVEKFITGSSAIEEKSLLLIRLDAIGDYILFQNYIDLINYSPRFSEHKITLIGNQAWKELELGKQHSNVQRFIWVDRKKFSINPIYRWRTLKKICSRGYDYIVQPTYSREYNFGDNIVKLAKGRHKIGNYGDLGNQTAKEKLKSDKYYTQLIQSSDKVLYEYERNRIFFAALLGMELKDQKLPRLPEYPANKLKVSSKKYVIFFIGANTLKRKWEVKNYARLASYLMQNINFKNHEIILCGSDNEKEDAKNLIRNSSVEMKNLVGKTTLVELTNVISGADLLITNETSAHHIGVATDCNAVVVIYAGNHYGRFVPLVDHNDQFKVVLHPNISRSPIEYCHISNSYGYDSPLNINDISVEKVIDVIDSL